MLEAEQISITGDFRLTSTVVAQGTDRSAAACAKSPPFTSLLVEGWGGFDLTLSRDLNRLRCADPSAEVQGASGAALWPIMFERAAWGSKVTRGVTNRQIALDCLSTRPVPSASRDVRAGFLFVGCW